MRWFGTCTDIDRLKRFTAEREQLLERERIARDEAEAASRAKDKFLAVLSHELRTPLSPVVMTIPSIECDPELPAKFREDLAMVRRNIDLEVKLIDDLLDLSRVTTGKLRLVMQPIRVHEVLDHAMRNSLSDVLGKRLDIRNEYRATDDRAIADPARLQQVFWNLLRNAVKFTREGGQVIVRSWNSSCDETGGDLSTSKCTTTAWASNRMRCRASSMHSSKATLASPGNSVGWGSDWRSLRPSSKCMAA